QLLPVSSREMIDTMEQQLDAIGIGYEGRSLDDVISILRLNGIELVIDVRLNAISRKRGFSKTALRLGLEGAGITYQHFPSLGNVRENRDGYSEIGTIRGNAARQNFRERLDGDEASRALDRVAKFAQQKSIALFCFEHDGNHCHREQVLEALRSRKVPELRNA